MTKSKQAPTPLTAAEAETFYEDYGRQFTDLNLQMNAARAKGEVPDALELAFRRARDFMDASQREVARLQALEAQQEGAAQ